MTLCWVMHSALLQRIGADWQAQAAYFARQSPILAALLDGAKPRWNKPVAIAAIPYGYLRREPISPAIFPVGDQLAVIPSFTGDGMSIALFSGIAAAQAVLAGESAEDLPVPHDRQARSTVSLGLDGQRAIRDGTAARAHRRHGEAPAAARHLARAIDAAHELHRRHGVSGPDPADQIAEGKAGHDLGVFEPRCLCQLARFGPRERALDRGPPIEPADVVQQEEPRAGPREPIA